MTPYDVVVVGAGPVGCVTALAFAKHAKRVLLLEANPEACERLAGEWLHPPAVQALYGLGVLAPEDTASNRGSGFVVFPDDGSERIVLPYDAGSHGFSLEHARLVRRLRERCSADERIDYREPVRVTSITYPRVDVQGAGGAIEGVEAKLIVDARGRSSKRPDTADTRDKPYTYSRMAGLLLRGVALPDEGFGHVFLGGPGPVLAYRLDHDTVRLCLDVPLSMRVPRGQERLLWEAFRRTLPTSLHEELLEVLSRGEVLWTANQTRARGGAVRDGVVVVGDAAGHHHPLTALGMTLGFSEAMALPEATSLAQFARRRARTGRVPQALAVALYEVFAGSSDDVVEIRQAVYELWRRNETERQRTMRYLTCAETAPLAFGRTFLKVVAVATRRLARRTQRIDRWRRVYAVTGQLMERTRWVLGAALGLSRPLPYALRHGNASMSEPRPEAAPDAARSVVVPQREVPASTQTTPLIALERAVAHLAAQQRDDGGWEGECIWCPMLPAQYVLMCRIVGVEIGAERRARILKQFERTQLAEGAWGLHELSGPYLFVTTLVYVAARMLGLEATDPLVARAGAFIRAEGGAVRVPSWGKFWLALSGLYEWEGVNPVLPELWSLPRWVPVHPGNYYCHTRLIYLGMAGLYGRQVPSEDRSLREALRKELFVDDYARVDWNAARHALRGEEVFTPPSRALRSMYDALRLFDRTLVRAPARQALRARLLEQIRFEYQSTDYSCISPVSGMLNLLNLWFESPDDPDLAKALDRLEAWVWDDERDGLRIAGARSASWDTAFAVQALTAASPHFDLTRSLERADAFLTAQQIRDPQATDYERFYRIDPTGGYCFAEVWHGWPVSDCTAEAMVARLEGIFTDVPTTAMTQAARFVLRTQCPGGGFGSYESFRPAFDLEWLNPAEMFGDSMTEHPYVECTASCVAALAAYRERCGDALGDELTRAIDGGVDQLRALQRADGSWSGNWGVHFLYGTMFAIRGLLKGGASLGDPAVRRGCAWIKSHQQPDGGWGESHESCLRDRYLSQPSTVVQTAWALLALLEADDPDWRAIERAAHFLASRQDEDGSWPREAPTGVFFHTALLHYELYRSYFPLWALGLYETRRLASA